MYKSDYKFEFGKGIELLEGKDGYIIACGIMVAYALEAAKQLRAEGFDAGVIDMHTIKPLDTELVLRAAARTGRLVTVEDAFITGGLGGAVCETIAEGGVRAESNGSEFPISSPVSALSMSRWSI